MKEKAIYDRVKRAFTTAHVVRFTDRMVGGIPDMNVCEGGVELWIEAKYLPKMPKRGLVRLGLSPEQANWLTKRKALGGNAYLLAVVGTETFVITSAFVDLVEGVPEAHFRELSRQSDPGLLARLLPSRTH